MSYENQAGGNSGIRGTAQDIGSQIAGHQGGFQYEPKPGGSLSGGVKPERNTFSGSQEPGYEHVTAPAMGGSYTGGHIESSGGSTYNPSSLGQQQGLGSGAKFEQNYGSSGLPGGIAGTGSTGGSSGGATIGGAGINKETVGSRTTGTGTGVTGTGSGTGSAAAGGTGLQQTVADAQRTAEPYVAQARDAAAPYVAKAQEVGSTALENARPYLDQAAGIATQAGQVGKEKATQAYNAAATELDARGINMDSTQQKLAEVGQTMKDYGAVGQQRAGEYLQQAVDQAKTIGQDGENKSIIATIFGTVFLVWLAFGFSIGAVFALGVAGSIAAVLSRYSRGHGSSRATSASGQQPFSQTGGQQRFTQASAQQPGSQSYSQQPGSQSYTQQPASQSYSQQPASQAATGNLSTSGVETHYPRPAHPDNSLHTNLRQ